MGFVVVIFLLDIILTGSIPKWAIFAPIFVPLFMQLGVGPSWCWRPIVWATRP